MINREWECDSDSNRQRERETAITIVFYKATRSYQVETNIYIHRHTFFPEWETRKRCESERYRRTEEVDFPHRSQSTVMRASSYTQCILCSHSHSSPFFCWVPVQRIEFVRRIGTCCLFRSSIFFLLLISQSTIYFFPFRGVWTS